MKQKTFDPIHDNAELMLANYFDTAVQPVEPEKSIEPIEPVNPDAETEPTVGTAEIKYTGAKPTIKVGGSTKTFTPVFSIEGVIVDKWSISDGEVDISGDTENYTIEYEEQTVKVKVALNYYLIGKVLTIGVVGTDGSEAKLNVEVIG